jgi:predicted RNase H-like HicB family nuclease
MQYQIFVENSADRTFMASAIGLPNATASGVTEKEAIRKLKGILDNRFKNGKLLTIEIDLPSEQLSDPSDPWIDNIGIFQDDPTFDDFLDEVNNYRKEIEIAEEHQ